MSRIGHNKPPSDSVIREALNSDYLTSEVNELLLPTLELLGESNEQLRTLNSCMTVIFMELGKPDGPDKKNLEAVSQKYLDWTQEYLRFVRKFHGVLADLADCREVA